MRKRSGKGSKVTELRPKRPRRDSNQMAAALIRHTIELTERDDGKDPMAVALGRRGGLKGGKARAANLTKEQLRTSAVKAARARWAKQKPDSA